MIQGLLVDLDDTLLANDTSRFLPAYFQRLSVSFPGLAPEDVLTQVLRATKRMMDNRNPFQTLKETFDQAFYPALGLDLHAARPIVEAFYRDVFPELRSLTARLPGAAELVQAARDLGMSLVVATNPMMPSTAVEQRLEWAGLPVSAHFFVLLTTYEDFHFAKPDPAYVAEILGRMGWRTAEAAMIGNDPSDDLQPAALLGLPVFHISGGGDDGSPGGSHAAAVEWLRRGPSRARSDAEVNPLAIEARLRGQAAALDTLTRGIAGDDWLRRPAVGLRSPVEIVCHLRDVEAEVTLPRLQLLTNRSNPFLPAPDTARWVTDRDYASQSGPEALATLRRLRLQLLDEIRSVAPDGWAHTGRHALLGPTTLAEVMSTAAEHEIVHLASLRKALSRTAETA